MEKLRRMGPRLRGDDAEYLSRAGIQVAHC
jgi:hypothetical protein